MLRFQTDTEKLKRTQCDWQMASCSPISISPFLTVELSQPLWVAGADSEREARALRGQEERVRVVAGGGSGGSFQERRGRKFTAITCDPGFRSTDPALQTHSINVGSNLSYKSSILCLWKVMWQTYIVKWSWEWLIDWVCSRINCSSAGPSRPGAYGRPTISFEINREIGTAKKCKFQGTTWNLHLVSSLFPFNFPCAEKKKIVSYA